MKNGIVTISLFIFTSAVWTCGVERLVPGRYTAIQSVIDDCNDGDYHLLPLFSCIDAADPDHVPENETDLDTNCWVQLTAFGRLREPGQYFYGSDYIRINPRPRP